MKRIISYLQTLTSLLLLSLLVIACSSDEVENDVPGSTGVVKAQISLSLDNGTFSRSQTRQTEDIVQGQTTPSFRGISDIKLIPFKLSGNETSVSTNSTRYGDNLTLKMATWPDNSISSSANYVKQLYADVDIPLGTDAFLFYGKASETSTDKSVNGSLIESIAITTKTQTLDKITFSLDPIYTSSVNEKRTNLLSYLKSITDAFGDVDNSTDEALKSIFVSFVKIKAGSSANIAAAVTELYKLVKKKSSSPYDAIKQAINNSTYASIDTNTDEVTLSEAISGYPGNLNLPDGAACILWDSANKEFVVGDSKVINGMNFADLSRFVYPAPLYYWANTSIKTAKVSMSEFYTDTGYDTWEKILDKYAADDYKDGTIVTLSTKSIALTEPINYAVALFDYSIQTTAANTSSLKDNEENDIPLTYNSSNSFPVTGIVVGGQKNVDWKFEPLSSSSIYFIYDNKVTSGMALTASASAVSHVLVLETSEAISNEDTSNQLNVAIELQNNSGQIFAGKDGLVYPGTKFYLIGTLNPYEANDNQSAKAFKKDYVTTATFKVSSLKNAYNTLPDLRLPQIELGLSVDLKWQAGITQTIVIN